MTELGFEPAWYWVPADADSFSFLCFSSPRRERSFLSYAFRLPSPPKKSRKWRLISWFVLAFRSFKHPNSLCSDSMQWTVLCGKHDSVDHVDVMMMIVLAAAERYLDIKISVPSRLSHRHLIEDVEIELLVCRESELLAELFDGSLLGTPAGVPLL